MSFFHDVVSAFGAIPDWALLAVPSALVLYTLATALFGGRRAYPYVSFALIALAAMLGAGRGAMADLVFTGLCAFVGAVARLVLNLVPAAVSVRQREAHAPQPADASAYTARLESAAVEAPVYIPISQCNLDMVHAEEYLQRLRRAPLTAGDRLEVDVLAHSLESANRAALTPEELVRINESLAAMFKIAAKYLH